MAVEYRRGNELLHGEIQPLYCERTDRYNNTLRYGDLGMDQSIRPVVGGFTAALLLNGVLARLAVWLVARTRGSNGGIG